MSGILRAFGAGMKSQWESWFRGVSGIASALMMMMHRVESW